MLEDYLTNRHRVMLVRFVTRARVSQNSSRWDRTSSTSQPESTRATNSWLSSLTLARSSLRRVKWPWPLPMLVM
jgi:hypothetical protein